jgi:hypothetical protein
MGGGYSINIEEIIEAHSNTFRLAQEIYFWKIKICKPLFILLIHLCHILKQNPKLTDRYFYH